MIIHKKRIGAAMGDKKEKEKTQIMCARSCWIILLAVEPLSNILFIESII